MDRRERAAFISMGTNALLMILKLAGASLSGSLALLADAWHSSSDIAVSLLVWVGIRFTGNTKRARDEAIVENGIAVIISLAIFYAAGTVIQKAVSAASTSLRNIPVAMALTLCSIIISLFISRYKVLVGRETGSPSLVADGQHSRMDMYGSAGVMAVLVGSMIGIRLDSAVAVVIGLLIVKIGLEVLIPAIHGVKQGELLRLGPRAGLRRFRLIDTIVSSVSPSEKGRRIYARRAGWIAAVAALLFYASTGVSIVRPVERGLLARFGRFIGDVVEPGIYLHRPFPVETMVTVEPHRVRRIEFGFRSSTRDETLYEPLVYEWENRHMTGRYRKVIEEALMLTGDENMVDVNMVVNYQIKDVRRYLSTISDVETMVRVVVESSAREIVGIDALEHILTSDRGAVQELLRSSIQERLDSYGAGIRVVSCCIQDIHPPVEVVSAFRDVASAREDRSRMINEAIAAQNDAVPRARGDAAREMAYAEAFKASERLRAEGEADRFCNLCAACAEGGALSRFRLFWETLESVLEPVEIFILKGNNSEGAHVWFIPDESGRNSYADFLGRIEE